MRIRQKFSGCGFCLSIYEGTVLCSPDHSGASLVSTIQNPEGPLIGGCFNTKIISIRVKIIVLCREMRHSWEGPLREAPLFSITCFATCYQNGSAN